MEPSALSSDNTMTMWEGDGLEAVTNNNETTLVDHDFVEDDGNRNDDLNEFASLFSNLGEEVDQEEHRELENLSNDVTVIPVTSSSSSSSSSSSFSKPPATNPDGKSPLSPYNLFFQLERKRILRGESGPLRVTLEEVRQLSQDYMSRPVRKHRKSHGRISFLELSRTVGLRWRQLDPANRRIFENQAAVDALTYRAAKQKNARAKKERRIKRRERNNTNQEVLQKTPGGDTKDAAAILLASTRNNTVSPWSSVSVYDDQDPRVAGSRDFESVSKDPSTSNKTASSTEGGINLQDVMANISPDPLSDEVSNQLALLRSIQEQLGQIIGTNTSTHQSQARFLQHYNHNHAATLAGVVSTPSVADRASTATATCSTAKQAMPLPPPLCLTSKRARAPPQNSQMNTPTTFMFAPPQLPCTSNRDDFVTPSLFD